MSQYSQMMGSFVRTANYPMEANYIFPTEEALKEFYLNPVNANTLHKGLLRIVENDGTGKQGLYWVTKKQTNDDLEFTKLISGTNIDSIFEQLGDFEIRLEEEIQNRKDANIAIQGTEDLSDIPEDLNSLLDLANNIISLREDLNRIEKPIQIYENMVSALQHETDEGSLFLVLNDDSLGKKGLHIIINENPTRIAFTSEVKQDISDLRDGIQLKLDEIDWYEG